VCARSAAYETILRTVIFDSYALLALLFDEPGADRVEETLHEAAIADKPVLITAVNRAERRRVGHCASGHRRSTRQ